MQRPRVYSMDFWVIWLVVRPVLMRGVDEGIDAGVTASFVACFVNGGFASRKSSGEVAWRMELINMNIRKIRATEGIGLCILKN